MSSVVFPHQKIYINNNKIILVYWFLDEAGAQFRITRHTTSALLSSISSSFIVASLLLFSSCVDVAVRVLCSIFSVFCLF